MADYDNRVARAGSVTDVIDAGLRGYMLRVYNYMLAGLAITGVAAYGTFMAATTNNPALAAHLSDGRTAQIASGLFLTSFGVTLFGPLMWVLMFGSLGLVLFLSFRINKMSVGAAMGSFLAYAALIGATFASIFVVYTSGSIAQVFFITAATFGAMSLWGYTTKSDLTSFGHFLFMGLIGIVIASVVGFFWHSAMLQWVISVAGVLIFTGLTAYDTQSIKEAYVAGDDSTVAGRKAIFGALRLYLDFINLFLMLLRLMGNRR
jgi:FtsH-binding integral membrane protein